MVRLYRLFVTIDEVGSWGRWVVRMPGGLRMAGRPMVELAATIFVYAFFAFCALVAIGTVLNVIIAVLDYVFHH